MESDKTPPSMRFVVGAVHKIYCHRLRWYRRGSRLSAKVLLVDRYLPSFDTLWFGTRNRWETHKDTRRLFARSENFCATLSKSMISCSSLKKRATTLISCRPRIVWSTLTLFQNTTLIAFPIRLDVSDVKRRTEVTDRREVWIKTFSHQGQRTVGREDSTKDS